MLTWRTYGSWLQGDKRGYVKDGKVLGANAGLERANISLLKGNAVKLGRGEWDVVRQAILGEAERVGEKVLAISVWSNHVHVVVGAGGGEAGKVVRQLKLAGYHALRKGGFEGRVWTGGYDVRFCFDEEALAERVRYVEGHD